MRIISGEYGGRKINPPSKMPHTRPTTDVAKEGLFNVLQHQIDIEGLKTLDLLVPLEAKCKVPVVSSTPHALMNAVRLAGISPRAKGYGSVLAKA